MNERLLDNPHKKKGKAIKLLIELTLLRECTSPGISLSITNYFSALLKNEKVFIFNKFIIAIGTIYINLRASKFYYKQ